MLKVPVKGVYMTTTRDEVMQYVHMCTQKYENSDRDVFTANHVADELKISRSLASQYLNELYKDGELIKILSRPVLFFCRKSLEEIYGFEVKQLDFLSLEEFKSYIQNNCREEYNFEDVIGAYGSLKSIIDNFKAGVKYPPRGLPILLVGENGTGKRILVRSVYKYALSQGIVDSHSRFIVIDAAKLDIKEKIIPLLFGGENQISQILESYNGIIYIRNTQFLNKNLLTKIINYFNVEKMDDKTYSLCTQATARIILESIDSSPEQLQNLYQNVPIICQMPALHERYNEEKEAYIYRYFQKESHKINKRIMVSTLVMRRLISYQYADNIDGLENIIQLICANANIDYDDKEVVKVYSYHLPIQALSLDSDHIEDYSDELSFIDIMNYQQGQENKQIEKIFDSILNDSDVLFLNVNENVDKWMNETKRHFQQYFEYLKFDKRMVQKQIRNIEFSIGDIIDNIFETYNMNEPTNFSSLVSKSIFFIKENRSFMNEWYSHNQKKMQEFLLIIQRLFKNEYEIIERMSLYIYDSLGIRFDDMNKIIYTLHLSEYVRGIVKKKCLGIIVSHGYSTATSIADAVNTMIGRNVFDSIDMPIETTTNEIVDKIKKYLVRVVTKNDLLVMVDMGSLQDIGDSLIDVAQSDIGIINNISTGLALEAGYMILKNESLSHILQDIKDHSICSFRYIQNLKMQPSIVFTSENGVNAARRLSELFIRSLPKNIDVDILTYDYFELMNSINQEDILKNKHVLFIFGVSDPHIPNISFVSLEDIMSMNKVDELYNDFSNYLTATEIIEFKKTLMKNFSLENVMKHLTILEPNRLIESVSESIDILQRLLNVQFSNQTIMGLYIHISSLIERLVTKEALDYGDTTVFAKEHEDFISHIHKSFENIFSNYGIDLPLSEMSYLYDYISIDSTNHITRQKRGLL